VRGGGGGTGLRHVGVDRLHDLDVEIGGGEAQLALSGLDEHIRQNGNGVTAFDDRLHMVERLEQRAPFDRDLHGLSSVPRLGSLDGLAG
jgi:hypothetical protein